MAPRAFNIIVHPDGFREVAAKTPKERTSRYNKLFMTKIFPFSDKAMLHADSMLPYRDITAMTL